MDILWLIGIFLGVDLLCGTSLAHISVLPISKDNVHRTQYRFQYYVRDERGDYKTQEEAGEGGKARGSYAVEEPDGDLRIVQYTADLGGGFKAHIKVDHAGKTGSKLQEIDIPAEEMKKLIESNRRKIVREEEKKEKEDVTVKEKDEESKSYLLGPPRKMSEIVMEQAAAIREIISKEIEAEEKREAEEKLLDEKKERGEEEEIKSVDEVDCGEKNSEIKSQEFSKSGESQIIEEENNKKIISDSRTPKLIKIETKEPPTRVESSKKNDDSIKTEAQSPVVRVALTPRKIEDVEKSGKKEIKVTAGDGPVQNFSFKNRIVFYKPVENKPIKNEGEVESEKDLKMKIGNNEEISDREEIVLYSPYQEGGKEGDRNSRFITVPYEVIRPYLTQIKGDEEKTK